MDEREFEKIIEKGESRNLEFKESLSLKNEIGESVSSFANACNGMILIGVSDLGEVKGVEIGKKTIEQLANYIKQNTDNSVYSDISIEDIDSKKIVVVKIKEYGEKPVFFRGNAYIRVGKSNHKLSASEIRKLSKESNKSYWDEQVCEGASLDDIDWEKVKLFLRKARAERRFDVESETLVEEALERLGLMKNRKLVNAGILLFGKNPQKFFLQSEIRCARFKGIEPIDFIDMKVFGGNIINQRDDAIEFVKEHIKLHAEIIDTERVEKWEYPIEAVREAITNAIVHRDYEISSNVQVRIFDDRIEVWNPGKLLDGLTVEKLKGKHESILRNPFIGKNFFLIKYVEQWGTGTNKIIKKCLESGLAEPIFEETGSSFVVTFRKYKISEEVIRGLNERQKKAIGYLKENERITRLEYEEINNISKRTSVRDLNELLKGGIVKIVGKGRVQYYFLK